MKIKQDPVTKLWCREDGAILLPPSGTKFRRFRWVFGSEASWGYRVVGCCHKHYLVHQIVCRAFNGLSPEDKPEVDHINRIKDDNRPDNLRWVSRRENEDNKDRVDCAFEKYGVRQCDDPKAYHKAYGEAHYEESQTYQKAYRATHKAEINARQAAYYTSHKAEINARNAAYHAAQKARGLVKRKCPDGKQHWIPKEAALCL